MSHRKYPPLTECKWNFDNWFRFVLAAGRTRDEVDRELGESLLTAAKEDSIEAWASVYDRANIVGEYDLADRLRKLIRGEE